MAWNDEIQTACTWIMCVLTFYLRTYSLGPHDAYRHRSGLAVYWEQTTEGAFDVIDNFFSDSAHQASIVFKWSMFASWGCAFAADTTLTAVLIASLRQSRTGFTRCGPRLTVYNMTYSRKPILRSDSIVNLLIIYAISTGMCLFVARSSV